MKDYHVDGNREMVAIGAMNMAGSLTSCYVATGAKLGETTLLKYLSVPVPLP